MKTCLKNNIINRNDDRLIQFAFMKIVAKCLYNGFKLIYCDESGIMTKNNHFKCLRKQNEQIYTDIENSGRYNLIMAVGEDIIYFEIKKRSNNRNCIFRIHSKFTKIFKKYQMQKFCYYTR